MREALSRLLLLLCCCVLCAALRSVAGAVRSERERHWTALVGRETTRRPALREREATESVLLSRISMWRSTFSRCRRQEFFTLSFASGASFANQKKVLLLLHSTLRPSFQQEAPLFLPFRLRSPRAPAHPRARVLCSCVSEQETLSLLTEQESAQTFDAFLLPPPLFFSSFASLDHRLKSAMTAYDEIEIEDMEWNEELRAFTFACPCGDVFQITKVRERKSWKKERSESLSLVFRGKQQLKLRVGNTKNWNSPSNTRRRPPAIPRPRYKDWI